MDAALIAEDAVPERFEHAGVSRLKRSHKTTRNNVTAWWDASQIYGFDARSLQRVRRDPTDSAKLQMLPGRASGRRRRALRLSAGVRAGVRWRMQRANAIQSSRNGLARSPSPFRTTGRSD